MALFERWRPTQKLDYEIPVVLFNNIIPFKGFKCINLFGILFVRKSSQKIFENYPNLPSVKRTLCHEHTHTLQMQEMAYVFFYIWYLIEWFYQLIASCFICKVKAYKMICFEQEAYANQSNYQYNKTRKHYAWVKWLFKYKVA